MTHRPSATQHVAACLLRWGTALAVLTGFCLPPASSPAAPPAPAHRAAPAVHLPPVHRAPVPNPHLHLPKIVKVPVVPHAKPAKVVKNARTHVRVLHVSAAAAGTLTGFVHDAQGHAVAGAVVHVHRPGYAHTVLFGRNVHFRQTHTALTDSSGEFTIHFIRPGGYHVAASKTGVGKGGHATTVQSGGVHRVDIRLAPTHKHKKRRGR